MKDVQAFSSEVVMGLTKLNLPNCERYNT